MIWLAIKLLIKLQKSKKLHHRITQIENIENDREIHRGRDISSEQRQKTIDDLRLI